MANCYCYSLAAGLGSFPPLPNCCSGLVAAFCCGFMLLFFLVCGLYSLVVFVVAIVLNLISEIVFVSLASLIL